MKFTKMQGLGNDYIYIDCMEAFPDDPADLAVKLSDRHFGIGGDGLICICPSQCADLRMRMFNADGTEGEMCGNGIRCAAKYALDNQLIEKTTMVFETKAGLRMVTLHENEGAFEAATVDMGVPILGDQLTIDVKGKGYTGIAVSTGNPHFVISVAQLDELNLNEIGPEIAQNKCFPNGTNVEFAEVLCKGKIRMRVWERGSGETLACGTGACAAIAVLSDLGYVGRNVTVCLPGGMLEVSWEKPGAHIFLSGPAKTVFEGEINFAPQRKLSKAAGRLSVC